MRKELTELRKIMKQEGITAYLLPCADCHGSEYVGAHDECVRYFSGFTGDSSQLLVLADRAYLWTDGRYFVQAEAELRGSGIGLMKAGEPGVPMVDDYLCENLKQGDVFGFYAPLFGARRIRSLRERLGEKKVVLRTEEDLADRAWSGRPERSAEPVWIHDVSLAGESVPEKLQRVRAVMKKNGCTEYLTSALDETAWLTNLRGSDIACNPVFLSHARITETSFRLYVQKKAVGADVRRYCRENRMILCEYDRWQDDLRKIRKKQILLDLTAADFSTWEAVAADNTVHDLMSPAASLKCVKNATEIRHLKESHIRDGVYVTKFLCRLTREVGSGKRITETDAAAALDALRAADSRYVSLSFPTISAYGANAAMCHYKPDPEKSALLKRSGFYLVDSGAQYLDGTTDVTRTVALGKLSAAEKRDYTLTVIGMLRLLHAVFPEGIRGTNLDTFAREPLWRYGRDFNHGTGHGVGFLNNVHEMPVSVRVRPSADPKRDVPFCPGMVTSDEPGIYVDGKYGIRTEIMIVCVKDRKRKGFLGFEPLTVVPLDPAPLDPSLMTDEDIRHYNEYQELVRRTVGPYLTEEEKEWLNVETAEIGKTGVTDAAE